MTQPEESGKGVIKVKLIRAGRVIRAYKVRSEVFTIGTAEGCTIRAAGDPNVQPNHASIYIDEGELTLVPEPGATVYMNDVEVDFAVPSPTDTIRIGKLTLQVELVESMASVPPPARNSVPAAARRATRPPAAEKTPQPRPQRTSIEPKRPAPPTVERPVETLPPTPVSKQSTTREVPKATPSVTARPQKSEPVKASDAAVRVSMPMAIAAEKTPPPQVAPISPSVPVPSTPGESSTQAPEPKASQPAPKAESVTQAPKPKASQPVSKTESDMPKADPLPAVTRFEALDPDYFFGDDDEDFDDSFDLTEMLLSERPKAPEGLTEPYAVALVVRVVDGAVAESFGVTPGTPYNTFDKELSCYIEADKKDKSGKGNRLFLKTGPTVSGELRIGNERRALDSHSNAMKLELRDGDTALLTGLGGTYKIEVYRPPLAPRKTPLFAVSTRTLIMVLVLALGFHGAAAYALKFIDVSRIGDISAKEEEVFAEVKLEELDKPETVEEQPIEEAPVEDVTSIAERAPKVSQKTIKRRVRSAEKSASSSSVSSLLNVLSRGSGKPGQSNKLKDMISNIDAVRSNSGAGSGFSIAGAIASLPGNGVNIARSGGGGVVSTLSGDEVAGKGSGVGNVGPRKRTGKVRGKVTKMSSSARIGGSLSQEDVLRVINSKIHAIQACYERALMSKPTLSGRIAMDWTVATNGSVKNVRVRSSTLGDPGVADCISGKIKRWKFPRPKGGEAKITFPFLFRSGS